MGSTFDTGRFDHEQQTGYALVGAHLSLDCASCHASPARMDDMISVSFFPSEDNASFPRMRSETCLSCHRDYHVNAFARVEGGPTCDNCHDQEGWIPTSFDLERHEQTDFPLSGGHIATPC
ncbi:MAG: cytochrome c3 family protein, partial [Rubricoccaceae bacterium]|nr:cytochrome c3 family protein [Rubricoccaceae bacterium]